MRAEFPPPAATRDPVGLGLLLAGVALAVIVAFALPALHFRGADKALLGISAWEAVPWLTKLKLAFLAAVVYAAFAPRCAALRLPLLVAAAIMMLLPAVGALIAALYQWSALRAEIVQLAGVRAPWIDPGWGFIVLIAASVMLLGAVWRGYRIAAGAR